MEPYPYAVYVIIGEEEFEYVKKKRNFAFERNPASYHGLTFDMEDEDGCKFSMIYIREGEGYDTIHHECVHATHQMMDSIGIPICGGNTEVVAYHVEWLAHKVAEEVKKRGH
jgi:hypothetical protein